MKSSLLRIAGRCVGVPSVLLGATLPAWAQDAGAPPLTSDSAPSESDAVPSPPTPALWVHGDRVVDVTVRAASKPVEQLRRSAEAVSVIETERAQRRSADLGEVLARVQGVSLRRGGGLGADTRFSLNGLDQVRFFLDGVPLELAGYPFQLTNIPINLIERIEIYRGVVPVRFGTDALGGAINLVSEQLRSARAAASYQVGSYGTHRLTVQTGALHEPSGFVAAARGFFDVTDNDYDIDVEVTDAQGTPRQATVPRFHDAYRGYGGALEVGVVDRSWARKLLVRGFVAGYEKELQNNVVMTVPYGEVHYGERVEGVTLRYEQPLAPEVELDVIGNYSRRAIDFVDKGVWVYDWYGNRVRMRSPGEIRGQLADSDPTDQTTLVHSAFGRVTASWRLPHAQVLRASLTPTYATRSGDDRLHDDAAGRDPLTLERDLLTCVSGLEYELNAWLKPLADQADVRHEDYRFQNLVFVKSYVYRADGETMRLGAQYVRDEKSSNKFGVGDSMRFSFARWAYAKASYEYATRLPTADQVFGNGVVILANLELEPEVSHNANLGPHFDLRRSPVGDFTIDVNGFFRDADRLIVLLGGDRFLRFQNIYRARTLGVEAALAWTSPGRYLSVHGNPTWMSQRNRSDEGAFAAYKGDRIPNRPYLFGRWGAVLRFAKVLHPGDAFEPFYEGRYVHEFYRGWESIGASAYKQVIERQITHDLGITYTLRSDHARLSIALEVQNLTDAKVYDFYGVQRPGQALFLKLTGQI